MHKFTRSTLATLAAFWLGAAFCTPAQAVVPSDALIEGAKLCTRHLPRYERENGIPTHLLSAIASTESGRWHEGLGLKIPWPWTINAEGKSYYYSSKIEAMQAVRRFRAEGIQSIDVGCMQVNLYHHPDAFASLDQAFEPETNIAYAASFLRSLYDQEGSWRKAAADYHSRTPSLGREYVSEVYNSWYQIIAKLRAARLQVPASSVIAMNSLKSTAAHVVTPSAAAATVPPVNVVASRSHKHAATSPHTRLTAARVRPHEHSIVVSSASQQLKQEDGFIVVHSDPPPVPAIAPVVASNDLSPAAGGNSYYPPAPMLVPVTQDRAVSTLDRHPLSVPEQDSKKTGPNFIFND